VSITDELERLAALRKSGMLTEEEFSHAKQQLLGKPTRADQPPRNKNAEPMKPSQPRASFSTPPKKESKPAYRSEPKTEPEFKPKDFESFQEDLPPAETVRNASTNTSPSPRGGFDYFLWSLFSFHGRIDRWEYFVLCSLQGVAFYLYWWWLVDLNENTNPGLFPLGLLVFAWPRFAISAKRWQDTGRSGWMSLTCLLCGILDLALLFIPSEPGSEQPRAASSARHHRPSHKPMSPDRAFFDSGGY
jgi:hypothetical protein